jgi:hypothetical protein
MELQFVTLNFPLNNKLQFSQVILQLHGLGNKIKVNSHGIAWVTLT